MVTHAYNFMDLGAFDMCILSSCVGILVHRLIHPPPGEPFERNEQCIIPVVLAEKGVDVRRKGGKIIRRTYGLV